jgi:hypothetical protein
MTEHADMPEKARRRRETQGRCPGVISVFELYRIEEAKARLAWSDSALRAAKRHGLKLITCGKRRYITGKEILRFLESQSTKTSN